MLDLTKPLRRIATKSTVVKISYSPGKAEPYYVEHGKDAILDSSFSSLSILGMFYENYEPLSQAPHSGFIAIWPSRWLGAPSDLIAMASAVYATREAVERATTGLPNAKIIPLTF